MSITRPTAPPDMLHTPLRPPVSTRHAFALAFDLAVRRDAFQSVLVPFLLRAPWIVALALLSPDDETHVPLITGTLTIAALIGDFVLSLVIGAMLRFRARSVFNTAADAAPQAAGACYGLGLRRLPGLIVTEVLRNALLGIGFAVAATPAAMINLVSRNARGLVEAVALLGVGLVLLLPVAWMGFRLALATEAVVLGSPNVFEAFRASFRLTVGRFERWLEMIVVSVLLGLCTVFVAAALSVAIPGPAIAVWVAVARLLVMAITPVIQYAWTFFYLRLVELDQPGYEVEPTYAAVPAAPSGSAESGPPEPPAGNPPPVGVSEPSGAGPPVESA